MIRFRRGATLCRVRCQGRTGPGAGGIEVQRACGCSVVTGLAWQRADAAAASSGQARPNLEGPAWLPRTRRWGRARPVRPH